MSHYFVNDASLESKPKMIHYMIKDRSFSLKTDAGVFSKDRIDEGTFIFLQALLELKLSGRILDLGCGYGALGLTLASFFPGSQFVLVDVNARAIALCEENAKNLRLTNAVTLLSDMYQHVEGTFDSIVINPPIRAGKEIIYGMFKGAYDHLNDGGSLVIVIRKSHGAESASSYIASVFGNCQRIDRAKGYHVYQAVKSERIENAHKE